MYKERYPLALYVYIKLQGILDTYQYALGTIEFVWTDQFLKHTRQGIVVC